MGEVAILVRCLAYKWENKPKKGRKKGGLVDPHTQETFEHSTFRGLRSVFMLSFSKLPSFLCLVSFLGDFLIQEN